MHVHKEEISIAVLSFSATLNEQEAHLNGSNNYVVGWTIRGITSGPGKPKVVGEPAYTQLQTHTFRNLWDERQDLAK